MLYREKLYRGYGKSLVLAPKLYCKMSQFSRNRMFQAFNVQDFGCSSVACVSGGGGIAAAFHTCGEKLRGRGVFLCVFSFGCWYGFFYLFFLFKQVFTM